MITNEQIRSIIDECKSINVSVKVSDIAYVLLCNQIKDPFVVFKVIFKNDEYNDFVTYSNLSSVVYLQKHINQKYKKVLQKDSKSIKKQHNENDITFEENKAKMVKLIEDVEKKFNEGEIEAKDYFKITTELRVKLNDKFKVVEEVKDSCVIIEPKFNNVCLCGREIYIPSKEDLIKTYNLIENTNTTYKNADNNAEKSTNNNVELK